MSNKEKKLISCLIALALMSSGLSVIHSDFAFAESDDDQHEGKVNKKNRVWTGEGQPLPKLGKPGDLYIDNKNSVYNIYKKTGKETWTDVTDIQGATGHQGLQGPAGSGSPNQHLPKINALTTVDGTGNVGAYTSITIGADGLQSLATETIQTLISK